MEEEHKIHQELTPLEVYDKFRIAHTNIKDCLYADNFEKMDVKLQNAIEALHGVLYMAEGQAVLSNKK